MWSKDRPNSVFHWSGTERLPSRQEAWSLTTLSSYPGSAAVDHVTLGNGLGGAKPQIIIYKMQISNSGSFIRQHVIALS